MSIALSFARLIKFAFQNFFRNFWLSFITITIFALTLLTVNAVLFMNVIANSAIETVEEKVEVTIYFTTDASEDIVKAAQGYLLGLSQVRNAQFISSEEALTTFKERHRGNETILASLDEVDGNPFGHAIVVTAHSPDDFTFILEAIETPEFSPVIKDKDFTDYEVIIERIRALRDRVRVGGIVLAGFFGLIAVMIIFNTIRVAIYVHRDEIGIMKLVGANDWFVRGPFLLEALFYSFFATVIIMALVFGVLGAIEPQIVSYFGEVDVNVYRYFSENALVIFGTQFLGLSVLSVATTAYAMRKYLRV